MRRFVTTDKICIEKETLLHVPFLRFITYLRVAATLIAVEISPCPLSKMQTFKKSLGCHHSSFQMLIANYYHYHVPE